MSEDICVDKTTSEMNNLLIPKITFLFIFVEIFANVVKMNVYCIFLLFKKEVPLQKQ